MTRSWCGVLSVLMVVAGQAPAAVHGKLQVEGGNPAAYRVVALTEPASELPADAKAVPVAADGSFTLAQTPAGSGYVAAYLGRYLDLAAMTNPRIDFAKTTESIELATKPARAKVQIVVSGPAGPLLRAVKVHLFGPFGRYDASTGGTAAEAGIATYENLPPGLYAAWVDMVHGAAGPNDPAAALFQGLEVTPGADLLRLPLKLEAGAAVHGKLTLPAGQGGATGWTIAVQSGATPLPGDAAPEAEIATGATNGYSWTTVAADGSFTLGQLPSGPLTLDLRRPGEAQAWTSLDVEAKEGQSQEIGTVAVPGNTWRNLFDGKDLAGGWVNGDFHGAVPAYVANRRLYVPFGDDMSGVTYKGPALPAWDYEVTLQGMRTEGHDFWCGLTFQVGKDPCTLVLGGWGGGVVGLSSIDGEDASQNPTSTFTEFTNWRWYRARIRVTHDKIEAWLDFKKLFELPLAEKRIGIRWEVEPSKPFGVATWRTTGALRDIRVRALP